VAEESVGHVFVGCGWTKGLLEGLGISSIGEVCGHVSRDWFEGILDRFGQEGAYLCAYGLWSIWRARNNFLFRE